MYTPDHSTQSSRDWSVLPEDAIIDQATDLPEQFDLDTDLSLPLANRADFGTWLRTVTRALRAKGLEKLIDIQIARPVRQSAKATRWLDFSRKIQQWLARNMTEELVQVIASTSQGARTRLADEFIDQAKKAFLSPSVYADIEGVASFMSMNVSSYSSAREFAWAFKDNFNDMWEKKGVKIPPYFALCMLMRRLDTFENRHVVASTISELHERACQGGDLWSSFSTVDFHVTVFNIIQRLEKTGKAAIMPTLTRPANLEVSKRVASFRQGTPPPGVKYFPPPGTNEDDYADGLRQSLPQMTKDKDCAYCGQKFHIASKCYYLNPESRPYYWKPLDDIWTYKKGQHGGVKSDENSPIQVNSPSLGEGALAAHHPVFGNTPLQTDRSISTLLKKLVIERAQQTRAAGRTVSFSDSTSPQSPSPIQSTEQTKQVDDDAYNKAQEKETESISEDTPTDGKDKVDEKFEEACDWVVFPGTPFDPAIKFNKTKQDWLVFDSLHLAHVCADRDAFFEYHEYTPDETPFAWTWIDETTRETKGKATAKGKGKVQLNLICKKGIKELVIDAFYYPDSRFSIFFGDNCADDHGLQFKENLGTFIDMKDESIAVGGLVKEQGFYFLKLAATSESKL